GVAPGDRILVAPFGSGAGSDAYSIIVTDGIEEKRNKAPKVDELVSKKIMISYSTYAKFRHMVKVVRE
ncbi:MAG: hydroxymethylglutaryl-CoA synthase, partial [Acidilobaceae archaeon]